MFENEVHIFIWKIEDVQCSNKTEKLKVNIFSLSLW